MVSDWSGWNGIKRGTDWILLQTRAFRTWRSCLRSRVALRPACQTAISSTKGSGDAPFKNFHPPTFHGTPSFSLPCTAPPTMADSDDDERRSPPSWSTPSANHRLDRRQAIEPAPQEALYQLSGSARPHRKSATPSRTGPSLTRPRRDFSQDPIPLEIKSSDCHFWLSTYAGALDW